MKHNKAIYLASGSLAVALVFIALQFSTDTPQQIITSESQSYSDAATNQPNKKVNTAAATKFPLENPKAIEAVEDNSETNPFYGEEAKTRLIQISKQFEQDIKYPSYSKPIEDEKALVKYTPNRSTEASLPIRPKDTNSPSINLKTDKLHYFQGEKIFATAHVRGVNEGSQIRVSGRVIQNGKTIQEQDGVYSDELPKLVSLEFDLGDFEASTLNDQLRVVASFEIEGRNYEIGSPIQYTSHIANIVDVASAQVRNEFLVIPINVQTSDIGYHQISANLYSAETGQPLVHLSAQKEMQTEVDRIELTAHIAALKAMGHEGPYLLKDMVLTRMPSPPKYTTEYGRVSQQEYYVEGFAFEEYDDVPYVDEEALARLDFLNQLGAN